jgi:AcrR family transcriptional regulator
MRAIVRRQVETMSKSADGASNSEDGAATAETGPLGRQALKSKRTRDKILQSAISLIKEGGYSSASASRIAERAGITWGAAQHHFGSKDDILDAVMDISHARFTARMASPALRTGSLADRVELFVDAMWEHYQEDVYLAGLEILLAGRNIAERPMQAILFERRGREHIRTLRDIFRDSKLDDENLQEALVFTHCLLTGLTVEKLLEGEIRNVDRHIRRGKIMLLTILSGI